MGLGVQKLWVSIVLALLAKTMIHISSPYGAYFLLFQHLYTSLAEVQITREEEINQNPLSKVTFHTIYCRIGN